MMKLSEMSHRELKRLEGTLQYIIADNPELGNTTVKELLEILMDEMETIKVLQKK